MICEGGCGQPDNCECGKGTPDRSLSPQEQEALRAARRAARVRLHDKRATRGECFAAGWLAHREYTERERDKRSSHKPEMSKEEEDVLTSWGQHILPGEGEDGDEWFEYLREGWLGAREFYSAERDSLAAQLSACQKALEELCAWLVERDADTQPGWETCIGVGGVRRRVEAALGALSLLGGESEQ